jgi:hypothetical protein
MSKKTTKNITPKELPKMPTDNPQTDDIWWKNLIMVFLPWVVIYVLWWMVSWAGMFLYKIYKFI